MLSVAVARSPLVVLRYVLWMTSCLHKIVRNRRLKIGGHSNLLTRGQYGTGAESDVYDCIVFKKVNDRGPNLYSPDQ